MSPWRQNRYFYIIGRCLYPLGLPKWKVSALPTWLQSVQNQLHTHKFRQQADGQLCPEQQGVWSCIRLAEEMHPRTKHQLVLILTSVTTVCRHLQDAPEWNVSTQLTPLFLSILYTLTCSIDTAYVAVQEDCEEYRANNLHNLASSDQLPAWHGLAGSPVQTSPKLDMVWPAQANIWNQLPALTIYQH